MTPNQHLTDCQVLEQDLVNSPPHYTKGIETIEIIRSKLTDEEYRGYLKGTIMTYNTRIGLKGSDQDAIDDAGKLSWYANKLKELLNEGAVSLPDSKESNERHQALDDVADEILNGKYCVGGTCED